MIRDRWIIWCSLGAKPYETNSICFWLCMPGWSAPYTNYAFRRDLQPRGFLFLYTPEISLSKLIINRYYFISACQWRHLHCFAWGEKRICFHAWTKTRETLFTYYSYNINLIEMPWCGSKEFMRHILHKKSGNVELAQGCFSMPQTLFLNT